MCKTEGVVDVFQVVKALRIQKPGAVLTVVSECIVQINWAVVEYYHIIIFALFSCRISINSSLILSSCF